MRVPWKLIGLAGLAGVAATGVVVARRRHRSWDEPEPSALRDRLHERLAEANERAMAANGTTPVPPGPDRS